jgi:hypothetical protein
MSAKSQTAQAIALQTDAAPASVSYRCLHSQKPRLDRDFTGKGEKRRKSFLQLPTGNTPAGVKIGRQLKTEKHTNALILLLYVAFQHVFQKT